MTSISSHRDLFGFVTQTFQSQDMNLVYSHPVGSVITAYYTLFKHISKAQTSEFIFSCLDFSSITDYVSQSISQFNLEELNSSAIYDYFLNYYYFYLAPYIEEPLYADDTVGWKWNAASFTSRVTHITARIWYRAHHYSVFSL